MKQIIFTLMMLVLPAGIMAQVDDLYYVPTKKKLKKEVKATTNDPVKVAPATVSTPSGGTSVVRIAPKSNIVNGIDEDAYNRRSTTSAYSAGEEYTDGQVYEQEEYADETASDADYTYSSRIVRFHSPRRAVVLSSPLYWDVVYNCGLDNWTIYDDGIYWDVYPDYSYSSIYISPWYTPAWGWYRGCGWGLSFGWGHSSWYWNAGYHHSHWYYPHYPLGGIHHHGHHIAGGSWHHAFNGGYRNATYSSRNGGGREGYVPRASGPSRADVGVRAGTVARDNRNASTQSNRTVRGTNNSQRVYDRPSSTRNNVTRTGVTNERTRNNGNNNAERATANTRPNKATRENNNAKATSSATKQKEVKANNRNERSSTESRSSVSRSNNSRNNNSRSTVGTQSRGSNFSGGSSRGNSGGGSRSGGGGGSRGGGGGRR